MIVEYHRPETLDAALALLARSEPLTLPLGGGTVLSQMQAYQRTPLLPGETSFAVVDLQALGLDQLERSGKNLIAGAAIKLEHLLTQPDLPEALHRALRHEATANLRQAASLAGTLISADGRSPFATAMLALDVQLECVAAGGASETLSLGDLLPLRREKLRHRLVTRLTIPLQARLAYAYTARTPADRPLVCAALAIWPSGRARLALGGYDAAPLLVLDGPEAGGIEAAAREAFRQAGDEWASAEYRSAAAVELALRCLKELSQE